MTHKANLPSPWRDRILAECRSQEPPPCQAACPLDIRVQDQIRLLREGKTAEALAVVLERCPFPGILGPVCRGGPALAALAGADLQPRLAGG